MTTIRGTLSRLFLLLLCAGCAQAQALSGTACAGDRLHSGSFELHEIPDASAGSIAPATGDVSGSVLVPATGTIRPFHLRVPPQYDPGVAWPLLVVLHGAPGSPTLSDSYARDVRSAVACAPGRGLPLVATLKRPTDRRPPPPPVRSRPAAIPQQQRPSHWSWVDPGLPPRPAAADAHSFLRAQRCGC